MTENDKCIGMAYNAVWRESGQNVILRCSFAGCSSSIKGYDAMYLYQDHKERRQVLYYHSNPGGTDKITPGLSFKGRVRTEGTLKDHTVTISGLTVDDAGVYSCVFLKYPDGEVTCSVYTLFVGCTIVQNSTVQASRVEPCSASTGAPYGLADEHIPPMVLIIIAACTLSTLATIIFILLIVPRVKRWTCSRIRTADVLQQVFNDNVYEVMTKNGLLPLQEQPPPGPQD
ncbi:uncharacterized protein LOC129096431 [Anoplopoma fimbria]|uniref:uncharacterized protein LOC129096431 n=1 Tax=Anoplopoma fimbria TaxID=229290 RepID=UPI0023EBEF2F|nr:uncharacterized protein LOC129096431 [Anoplopoma fimbria]